MTIQDLQVSTITPTDDRTASQSVLALLRRWAASYVALYEPKVDSTVVDVSSQLSWVPVR